MLAWRLIFVNEAFSIVSALISNGLLINERTRPDLGLGFPERARRQDIRSNVGPRPVEY